MAEQVGSTPSSFLSVPTPVRHLVTLPPLSVMVVNNDRPLSRYILTILEGAQYDVITCESGEAQLTVFETVRVLMWYLPPTFCRICKVWS